jgi:hypothetical protein
LNERATRVLLFESFAVDLLTLGINRATMTDWQLARAFIRRLLQLRRFSDMVEQTFVERAAALDAELATASNLPEHEREDLVDWYASDFLELGEELPTVLRYAVLTAADTASEAFLNRTCDAYAEVSGTAIRVKDLQGAGIRRAREYLTKVASIQFPDDRPNWTTVLRLHGLRNCIVHAEGVVAPSRAELRKWSASIPGLRISDYDVVSLDAPFTKFALDGYETFGADVDLSTAHLGLWSLELPFESI